MKKFLCCLKGTEPLMYDGEKEGKGKGREFGLRLWGLWRTSLDSSAGDKYSDSPYLCTPRDALWSIAELKLIGTSGDLLIKASWHYNTYS
jgi:hypothetical protein